MVHIALSMGALYNLEVKVWDVLITYMITINEEKVWTVLGWEFGDNAGKNAIIVRVLYGLKSVGASFKGQCMQESRYGSFNADPDLLLKPETSVYLRS